MIGPPSNPFLHNSAHAGAYKRGWAAAADNKRFDGDNPYSASKCNGFFKAWRRGYRAAMEVKE